jgi:hypothetical protein
VSSTPPAPHALLRPLPLRGLLRVGRAAETWHKAALSALCAVGGPLVLLLALGRLDLAGYCCAGAFCVLYGHTLPYAARARTLAGVALAMLAGAAVSMATAALTDSTALRVAVAALLAALQKAGCDAARIGPPGNVVLTFLTSSLIFVPQRLGDLPAHLALAAAGAVLAWAVCLAPALVRPHGPERRATARALEAAARLAEAGSGASARTRHEAAAAMDAAGQTLARAPRGATRRALEQLLLTAETAGAASAAELAVWARDLRRGRPVPRPFPEAVPQHPVPSPPRPLRALRPGSPLVPVAVRTALGCAVAGWASMALGVGRPYWAVVTAASVFQASTALSWYRAANRVLGNLLGVALFAVLLPLLAAGPTAMVVVALCCVVAVEATMARSYWLGSTFVTPLALIMTQFAGLRPAGALAAERFTDTAVGAGTGLLCCLLVTNRRATRRIHAALGRVTEADAAARRLLAGRPSPADLGKARHRLTRALLELREAADTAAGEWWQPAPPQQALEAAERTAHATLAELAQRRAPLVLAVPLPDPA